MSSSRRAQAIRQRAIISGHESEPIPFSLLVLARKSRRYLEELVLGSGPGGIVIDPTFDPNPVLQFISACQRPDFSLTLSNVFEIELLCDEWSVPGKPIRQKAIEFIKHSPSGQTLWLRRLLFRLGRGLPTSEAEDLLRCNLVGLVCDPAALDIPAAILSRIIDFRSYEGRREEYERPFTFCMEYLRARGSSASQIMRTLDATGLSNEDLRRLCTLEPLNWSVLDESVRQCLIGLRKEVEEQRKEIVELTNLLKRPVLHPEEANTGEIIERIFPESKQFPPSAKKGKIQAGFHKREVRIDVPEGIIAHQTRECGGNVHDRHQSGHLGELSAVVGLGGGSRVKGGLSARGLANVAVRDWSHDFMFIVGDHSYRCPSSVAQFLSPRVAMLHSIDDTIDEIRIDVEDGDELFGSVLEAAQCGGIAVSGERSDQFSCSFQCQKRRRSTTFSIITSSIS
jgi:hypothetical protein